jgi:hypothetical protein
LKLALPFPLYYFCYFENINSRINGISASGWPAAPGITKRKEEQYLEGRKGGRVKEGGGRFKGGFGLVSYNIN